MPKRRSWVLWALPVRTALAVLCLWFLGVCSLVGQDWSNGNGQGYTPMGPATVGNSATLNGMKESVLPGAPVAPNSGARPASWPGQGEITPWQAANPQQPVGEPVTEMKPCDGTRILARVGSDAIFEGEVIGFVNQIIEANKARIPPDQLETQRELLIQQRLKGLVETKLIYQDAKRTIPSESWSHVEKQLGKHFEEAELDRLLKNAGVATSQELDLKFRSFGSSLEREKRAFTEQALAREWVGQQVKPDGEVTHNQMVAFYRDHQKEFTTPARAQWEELMVSFSKYPNNSAAYDAIARMGNQVFAGEPFAQVAKNGSDGLTASRGGRWKWTTRGALANEAIDQAIFNLPVGQMSPILEGPKGFHIVRVIKREDAEVKPFLEAQVDIKKKIVEERSQKQLSEYMAKLRERTPVWIYDSKDGNLRLASPADQQPIRR